MPAVIDKDAAASVFCRGMTLQETAILCGVTRQAIAQALSGHPAYEEERARRKVRRRERREWRLSQWDALDRSIARAGSVAEGLLAYAEASGISPNVLRVMFQAKLRERRVERKAARMEPLVRMRQQGASWIAIAAVSPYKSYATCAYAVLRYARRNGIDIPRNMRGTHTPLTT